VYIDNVELVKYPCERSPPTALPDCYLRLTNCSFTENTLCGWKSYGKATFVKIGGKSKLHVDYDNTLIGKLDSLKSCHPEDRMGCLTFNYGFDVNETVVLSVVLFKYKQSSMGTTVTLWSASTSKYRPGQKLDTGRVPISVTYDYSVSFEIYKQDGVAQPGHAVYISDVTPPTVLWKAWIPPK
jgi:hypothetical protein